MSSRRFFLCFFLCALVPLAAAKISLTMGWFSQASTNKGVWLEHEIQLLPDYTQGAQEAEFDPHLHWHLVYVQAADCAQQCEQALALMQKLYAGLGRKQIQVKPLLMAEQAPQQLTQFPSIDWQLEQAVAKELRNQIVIVNQRGLVLLRYPLESLSENSNQQQHNNLPINNSSVDNSFALRQLAKDIRTDLLRLMNYDRSGA